MLVWFLGQEDPPEVGATIHSSILAWRIPRTEEPGGLQSTGCGGKESVRTEVTQQACSPKMSWSMPGPRKCSRRSFCVNPRCL